MGKMGEGRRRRRRQRLHAEEEVGKKKSLGETFAEWRRFPSFLSAHARRDGSMVLFRNGVTSFFVPKGGREKR